MGASARRAARWLHRRRPARVALTAGPPMLWLALFYLAPLAILLSFSLWRDIGNGGIERALTVENYRYALTDATTRAAYLRTLGMALAVTAADALLAFPLAYFIAQKVRPRRRQLLLLLVVFPLWSSYLVRLFAWKTILGDQGILNSLLVGTGVLKAPSSAFIYSNTGMFITFIHIWLPFMVLPLVTALERVPGSLFEASADLGARGAHTLRRVVLPLAAPGIAAGAVFTFGLTMGDYFTPRFMGSGSQFVGNLVADRYGIAGEPGQAAAILFPVLVIVALFLFAVRRAGGAEVT